MGDMAIWNDEGRLQTQQPIHACSSVETPSTKTIASEIYTRLPLELRNRIYTFCVQGPYDNEVIVRRSVNSCNAFDFLVRESSGPHSYLWVEDQTASYVSAERMTADIAREMLEAYYWTRVFKFSHRELDLLGPFLGSDVFGLGTIPVLHARRLHIQIRPFACATNHSFEQNLDEQQRCYQAIAALATIRSPRTEVVVQLDLGEDLSGFTDYEHFSPEDENFLLKLVRDLVVLKERGLRIEIVSSRTWNEQPSTRIRSRSVCSPEECIIRLTKAARHVRL